MSKLLSLSLVALLAISSIVPLTTSMATAKGTCGTDHACPPGNPGDPGNPGTPGDPGDPGDPGGPGNNQPYEDPTVTVADNTPSMLIACRTKAGDDDLRFRNIGDLVIPGGTRVYWLVKETGDHGYFFLPADLKVGETVIDADALTLGTPDVMHCYSRLM